MILAECCLGDARRDWALAMKAEFEVATEAAQPLAFATGCLIAACREMPRHEEGRFVLTNHLLVLGILVPMAGFQLLWALSAAFPVGGTLHGTPTPGNAEAAFMFRASLSAVPSFLGLWLFLCLSHLRLAWALLERDWERAGRIGSLIAAGTATLLVCTCTLLVVDSRTVLQVGVLTVELAAVAVLARWHAQLVSSPAFEKSAR